jgi:hypothetical protein
MLVLDVCFGRRRFGCRWFGIAHHRDMFVGFEPEFTVLPFYIAGDQQDQTILYPRFCDGFPSEGGMGVASGPVIDVVVHLNL